MISSSRLDSTTVHITVTGRLALENTQELKQLLQDVGEEGAGEGAKYILMSMDELEFMDSSGLSALVSGLKTARKAGGDLFLIAPSAAVNQLLELTLLNQVIPIVPTLEAARQRRA
ncbi:STAS domain-containing protein (plasmid) [Deinococcus sp. KNUC1210]|uniref:STAS domain-containing protein n=1 Tax=Deinococcus sp. KNUC1210 TaxID=2917691 RepID=UPI001EF0F47D|nr:STAS domain-containing protein [Deinococcus sp. KNUC1210]ULH17752.1 STAS domain-containing protein [Deinococcus sp. KNUC1210]